MKQQTALVLGATGMIGNSLLHYLLNDETYSKVIVLVRSPLNYMHEKLQVHVVDFTNAQSYSEHFENGDVIFCCIGTTMKKVKGDKILYRQIDFDIPVNAARLGIEKGYKKYILVSAVGAEASSGNFYLKLKGETEDAVKAFSYDAIQIMRPSLLLGKRMEMRFGEQVAQAVMPVFSFLLGGGLSKYRPIQAGVVAKAMIKAAAGSQRGTAVHHYTEIEQLSK